MVEIGDHAPKANVKRSTKDEVNQALALSETYGDQTTVFYFFPAIFTGVCTESSCELRDDIGEFEELGARIFGVSTDMPFSQKIFIKEHGINYPLLSDWNREMIEAFDVVDNTFAGNLKGVAKRSLFAIQDGKVIYKWIAEHPGKYPPFDDLKAILHNREKNSKQDSNQNSI